MNITTVLEMAADGAPDRVAVGPRSGGVTYLDLYRRSMQAARYLRAGETRRVALLDVNSVLLPTLLFGAAGAGIPFVPLNYRLARAQLRPILERLSPGLLVESPQFAPESPAPGLDTTSTTALAAELQRFEPDPLDTTPEPDLVAVTLFTSGTTGAPKAAVLRHTHLTSYVLSTVEFMAASEDEAALVSVPPYHVAAIAAILTSVYAGRRTVQLDAFDPIRWVDTVRAERITHAMVVPTMLSRVLDVVEARKDELPSLRHLSYGGGRMPVDVLERALGLLPNVDFVNAYGLTETSSSIALLGPDDHRTAAGSADPAVRARLASVGRPLPDVEVEIRDDGGGRVSPGTPGEIYVRGPQVAGEYESGSVLDEEGWLRTRDGGLLDGDGFLYVSGRLDDVIVRGGENLSPGEIEDALRAHPAVLDVGVVGLPDEEWGETVAAAVVLGPGGRPDAAELRTWVQDRLRSSRVPQVIVFVAELPYTDSGKLVRYTIRQDLAERLLAGE